MQSNRKSSISLQPMSGESLSEPEDPTKQLIQSKSTQQHHISNSKYQSLNEQSHLKHAKTSSNLSNKLNLHNENSYKNMLNHKKRHLFSNQARSDASNLAFPINPFDHLMPHKNDIGTPNMAWIGTDGLVHTPRGGAYAKTTEAIANFRRELQFDNAYYRTRQRYICLILFIIFLTICAVVVLLIARDVTIMDVELLNGNHIWRMNDKCSMNESVSNGCNVTISPLLNIKIDNHNMVPATVNTWSVLHLFFCPAILVCPSGGTMFGHNSMIHDGNNEINRKNIGYAVLNDTESFMLPACRLYPPNGTYCEWQNSCIGAEAPKHFVMEMQITVQLSFALQSAKELTTVVRLGIYCNGTAIICKIDGVVKSSHKVCG